MAPSRGCFCYEGVSLNNVLYYLLALLILSYFLYHIALGERGAMEFFRIRDMIASKVVELQELSERNSYLEHVICGLRAESLDVEILEEFAKLQLGLINKDEMCFILR